MLAFNNILEPFDNFNVLHVIININWIWVICAYNNGIIWVKKIKYILLSEFDKLLN
jgi:hypothetical protein